MLSIDEKQEIQRQLGHYPDRRAACIEAMMLVQQRRGWIADEMLRDIAAELGMQPTELEAVATFFNLIYRRPVGRHVIHLCESVSCWMLGSDDMRDHLRARLAVDYGGTSADGRYTLLPIVCLGACDRGPALILDGELHDALTPDRIDVLLQEHT